MEQFLKGHLSFSKTHTYVFIITIFTVQGCVLFHLPCHYILSEICEYINCIQNNNTLMFNNLKT